MHETDKERGKSYAVLNENSKENSFQCNNSHVLSTVFVAVRVITRRYQREDVSAP